EPANFEAYHRAPAVPRAGPVAVRGAQGGFVASADDRRQTPTFFWAERGKPLPAAIAGAGFERIARHHVQEHASLYGLSPAALATAKTALVHDTGRGGVIVVLRQRLGGVPVLHSDMKVLMDRTGALVAIGGSLHPDAVPGVAKKLPRPRIAPADAIV